MEQLLVPQRGDFQCSLVLLICLGKQLPGHVLLIYKVQTLNLLRNNLTDSQSLMELFWFIIYYSSIIYFQS